MPQWGEVTSFARGEAQRYLYERKDRKNPFAESRVATTFTFEDVQSITRSITAGFGHWWEQECQGIKSNLMALDTEESGRVKLSKFYRANFDGEWRFGESEAYLRELGALDDSSFWRGPQVLIPNYLLAASNCIVASTYYLVCCINECESLLQHVEDHIQAPVASLEQLVPVVESLFMDANPLTAALRSQLDRIAETHRGRVPLHGRLFAQWMHYAFPQECPFPHPAGKAAARTPAEFGDAYAASPQEMRRHIKKGMLKNVPSEGLKEEEQWGMSQLLHEEE